MSNNVIVIVLSRVHFKFSQIERIKNLVTYKFQSRGVLQRNERGHIILYSCPIRMYMGYFASV